MRAQRAACSAAQPRSDAQLRGPERPDIRGLANLSGEWWIAGVFTHLAARSESGFVSGGWQFHMHKTGRTKALYAGSFDPITRGHLDIIGKR